MILGLDVETNKDWRLRTVQIYYPDKSLVEVYLLDNTFRVLDLYYTQSPDFIFIKSVYTENHNKDAVLDLTSQLFSRLKENSFITHSGVFDHFIILKNLGIDFEIAGDSFFYATLVPLATGSRRSLDALMKQLVNSEYDKYQQGISIELSIHRSEQLEVIKGTYVTKVYEEISTPGEFLLLGDVVKVDGKKREILSKSDERDGFYDILFSPVKASWEDFNWDEERLPEEALLYAARDAYATFHIEDRLKHLYPKYNNNSYRTDLKTIRRSSYHRLAGLNIDRDSLRRCKEDLKELRMIEQDNLDSLAGRTLEVNSIKSIQEFLFKDLKLPSYSQTARGLPRTSESAIALIDHQAANLVRNLKKIDSMRKKIDELPHSMEVKYIDPHNIFLYPNYGIHSLGDFGSFVTTVPHMRKLPQSFSFAVKPSKGKQIYYLHFDNLDEIVLRMMISSTKPWYPWVQFTCDSSSPSPIGISVFKDCVSSFISGFDQQYLRLKHGFSELESNTYFSRFIDYEPDLFWKRKAVYKTVKKRGIVKTIFGRVYRVDNAFSSDPSDSELAIRKGFEIYFYSALSDLLKNLYNNVPYDSRCPIILFSEKGFVFDTVLNRNEMDKIAMFCVNRTFQSNYTPDISSGMGLSWGQASSHLLSLSS